MIPIREVLATNLKKYRHRLGWSQAKLAERMNTSAHYIGMIEIGKKFPKPEMLEKLAETLGIDSSQLFSREIDLSDAAKQLCKVMLEDINGVLGQVLQGKIKELDEYK